MAGSLFHCCYIVIGGGLTPLLVSLLFARDRALGAFGEAVPAFVIVSGTILLWPLLMLLVLEAER